jgi:hypothetical protein
MERDVCVGLREGFRKRRPFSCDIKVKVLRWGGEEGRTL